jgi:pumilio homology domain family member 6
MCVSQRFQETHGICCSFCCCLGYARSGLLHKDAYLAILRLVQLTDDTVVVQKNLLQELVTTPTKNSKDNVIVVKTDSSKDHNKDESTKQDSPLLEICTSETGSKLFLMLLPNPEAQPGAWRKYFDPYELSVLFENPTIPSSSSSGNDSSKLDKATSSTDEPTSKKNPILKRQELLDNCLREPLLQLCCLHTEELLRSRPGCAVLREVYQAFTPKTTELVQAVIDACVASLNSGNKMDNDGDDKEENEEDDTAALPLLEDRIGHLAIKNLLLLDATVTTTTESSSMFATQFMDRLGDRLMEIAQANRGAFVVAAICKVPSVRKSAIGKLDQKRLQELSKQENVPTAGFVALLKEIKSL